MALFTNCWQLLDQGGGLVTFKPSSPLDGNMASDPALIH
jgi:hypothetical protein